MSAASRALAAAAIFTAAAATQHSLTLGPNAAAKWSRAECGPGDQVTQWGAAVDPNNVLPEHPRPQLYRDAAIHMMNGVWEWQVAASESDPVPFGQQLNGTILVPFPPEACLSGIGAWGDYAPGSFKYMFYRVVFDAPAGWPVNSPSAGTLLHFDAVDWRSTVYLNGAPLGAPHEGGYDAFEFDVSSALKAAANELIVRVFDPSDQGYQVNGKQRISAINNPGGDTYVPSSGIWLPVWLEQVPLPVRVARLDYVTDTSGVTLTATTEPPSTPCAVHVVVTAPSGAQAVVFDGVANAPQRIDVPSPVLWSVGNGNLYTVRVTVTAVDSSSSDTVNSYFGLRTVSLLPYTTPAVPMTGPQAGVDRPGDDLPGSPFNLPSADPNLCWAACNTTAGCAAWAYGVPNCGGDPAQAQCWLKAQDQPSGAQACRVSGSQGTPPAPGMRPAVNGKFVFLAGWLDQSWWPDGEYTAPSDEALSFDLEALALFGLNSVRLHQKVNSDRWYYHADRLGVAVQQDMIQKYGGASAATVAPFLHELQAMIDGRRNHPSIYMWTCFNEGDDGGVFPNVSAVVEWVQSYDTTRLVDTNSGGPFNNLHIGSVNDVHCYPDPCSPLPNERQFAEQGEFGGMGAFIAGREWVPGKCSSYSNDPTPAAQVADYVRMARKMGNETGTLSVSVYTQLSDVERECDGFFNMDRSAKFNAAQTEQIKAANDALIAAAAAWPQ